MMSSQENVPYEQEVEIMCSQDFNNADEDLSFDMKPTTESMKTVQYSYLDDITQIVLPEIIVKTEEVDHQVDIKPYVDPPLEDFEQVFLPDRYIKTEMGNLPIDIKPQKQLLSSLLDGEKANQSQESEQDLYLEKDLKADVEERLADENDHVSYVYPLTSTSYPHKDSSTSNAATVTSSVNLDQEVNPKQSPPQYLPSAKWVTSKVIESLKSSTEMTQVFEAKDQLLLKPMITEPQTKKRRVGSVIDTSSYVECLACHLKFKGSVYLAKHVRDDCKLICKYCTNVFDSNTNMKIHISEVHPFVKCGVCCKMYRTQSIWRSHNCVVDKKKPGAAAVGDKFTCGICGITLKGSHNLLAHMKIHTVKPNKFKPRKLQF